MGNAVGNDTRLAAARTRKNQHRAFRSFHGFALLRVKLVEKRQCGSGSGVGSSILQGIEEARRGSGAGIIPPLLWPRTPGTGKLREGTAMSKYPTRAHRSI